MSAERTHEMNFLAPPVVRIIGMRSLVIGLVFSALAGVGAYLRPDEFFRAYLLGFMCWLGVTLGSLAFLMVRHVTGGTWGMVIQRIQDAAMRCLPLTTLLFIPILFGLPRLYVWARPLDSIADKHLREHLADITQSYLNVHGFMIRAAIYFAIWNVLAFFLSKWSRELDHPPMRSLSSRFKALSSPGLILYAFSIGFAAIDWLMSIDPTWISTMYGLIILIGEIMSAMCFAVVIERILSDYEPMRTMLKPSYVHDHGKWMLAFVMVWAYFSFSQLLIIWAGNLPDEITWYIHRIGPEWGGMALFLAVFQFCVPFALLLSRPLKRNIHRLAFLAAWIMFMRYVDLFWIIEPNYSLSFHVTLLDVVVPVAIGGLWLAMFFHNLGSRPLLAAYDIQAQEVLEPAHGGH